MNAELPSFPFKLVSPERVLFSGETTMVVLPGLSGALGVLYNHAPTILSLNKGIIDVYKGEDVSERLFVGGGFANINESGCTVMANDATPVEDLKEEEIEDYIKTLQAEIDQAIHEEEKQALRQDMTINKAKIDIIKQLVFKNKD